MSMFSYLSWSSQISGASLTGSELSLGILFPAVLSNPQTVLLQSAAGQASAYQIANLTFSLNGDSADLVRSWGVASAGVTLWPQADPIAGAGLDLSFDGGATWTRFSAAKPLIPMLGTAVNKLAPDGRLAPNDVAGITLRLTVPSDPPDFGSFHLNLEADFDVW